MSEGRNTKHLLGLDLTPLLLSKWASQIPLTKEEMQKVDDVASMLQSQKLPELIQQYENDLDRLAFYTYLACGYEKISEMQLATVLEIRAIYQSSPDKPVVLIEKINSNALPNPLSDTSEYLDSLYTDKPETKAKIKAHLLEEIAKQPNPDAYAIKFIITKENLPTDIRFQAFLQLAQLVKSLSVTKSFFNDDIAFTMLSAGARDLLTKLVYKEHAKQQRFFYGKGISREMILAGEEERARFAIASFPDVEDVPSIHQIPVPPIFAKIHDDLHQQGISAIPNGVYSAFLHLAKQLQRMAGRPWSPEIWHLVDMDFSVSRLKFGETPSNKDLTSLFFNLLSEGDLDGNPVAIFLPTPYCDTSWMILMDMVEHKAEWEKFGIKPDELPEPLKEMYYFLYDHLEEDLPLPVKLLKLKCEFLQIPYPKGTVSLSKRAEKIPVPIEILVDGKPYPISKRVILHAFSKHIGNPHLEPVMRAIQSVAATLPVENYAALFFYLKHILWMTQQSRISASIDADTIKVLIAFLTRVKDHQLLDKFYQPSEASLPSKLPINVLSELTKVKSNTTFDFVVCHSAAITNIDRALRAIGLSLDDLSQFNETNLENVLSFSDTAYVAIKFPDPSGYEIIELLKSQPEPQRLFLLAYFNALEDLLKDVTTNEFTQLLVTHQSAVNVLLRSNTFYSEFLKRNNLTLSTFIDRYQAYFSNELFFPFPDRFSERLGILTINLFLVAGLTTLEDFFTLSKKDRLYLIANYGDVLSQCHTHGINLSEYVKQFLKKDSPTLPAKLFDRPAEAQETTKPTPSLNGSPKGRKSK
jgi:hypothetical protein